MTAVTSAGFFAATNIKIVRSQTKPAIMLSDDEIQTGSILFVPDDEKVCRQFLFDNRTGWLTYIGFVDCEGAFNKDLNGKATQFAAWRAKVISESFRGQR